MAENICITEFSPEDFRLGSDSLMIESSPGVFELTEEVASYSADGEQIRINFSGRYNKATTSPFYSTSIDFLLPPEVPSNYGTRVNFGRSSINYRTDGTFYGPSGSGVPYDTLDYDLNDGRWYTLKSAVEFTEREEGGYSGIITTMLLDSEGSVLEEGITLTQRSDALLNLLFLSTEIGGSIPIKVRNLEFCAESFIDAPTDLFDEFSLPNGSGALIFGIYDRIHRDYENGVLDAETIRRANKALTYAYGGAYANAVGYNAAFNIYLGNIDI